MSATETDRALLVEANTLWEAALAMDDGQEWRPIADALAAERERARAPFRKLADELAGLADSYGRWPFRVDPLHVTRRIDGFVDRIRRAAEDDQ